MTFFPPKTHHGPGTHTEAGPVLFGATPQADKTRQRNQANHLRRNLWGTRLFSLDIYYCPEYFAAE